MRAPLKSPLALRHCVPIPTGCRTVFAAHAERLRKRADAGRGAGDHGITIVVYPVRHVAGFPPVVRRIPQNQTTLQCVKCRIGTGSVRYKAG